MRLQRSHDLHNPNPNELVTMVLCNNCEEFDIRSFRDGRPKGYLLSTVEDSARQGCEFCGYLCRNLQEAIATEKKLPFADIHTIWIHLRAENAALAEMGGKSGLALTHLRLRIGNFYWRKPSSAIQITDDKFISLLADAGRSHMPQPSHT